MRWKIRNARSWNQFPADTGDFPTVNSHYLNSKFAHKWVETDFEKEREGSFHWESLLLFPPLKRARFACTLALLLQIWYASSTRIPPFREQFVSKHSAQACSSIRKNAAVAQTKLKLHLRGKTFRRNSSPFCVIVLLIVLAASHKRPRDTINPSLSAERRTPNRIGNEVGASKRSDVDVMKFHMSHMTRTCLV